jgi:DNA invertase Pin-like site-specific DNA recombinase
MSVKQNQKNETLLKNFAKGKGDKQRDSGIENCVIYTRVSSKEQMETNQSLEWQKKFCTEYAQKNAFAIKGYYGGTYESAKSDERKEFGRMLQFVKASKEKIVYILVYSLDRFSRTGDSAIFIASELKKLGINIVAVTQPIDTNSHAGSLQQNIHFIFSKYDNDMRRQKTIDGMREKLLRGDWIGNAPTGYAFESLTPNQKIVINDKGNAIKFAFEWRANGMTYEQIIYKLKAYGLSISKQTLAGIIKNPFYCGLMSHNLLKGELLKGNHPALIDQDLFLKANKMPNNSGYKVNKANDNLPLKVFVKDAQSGAPFTGYLAKKKGLYYYKVNKTGVKVNRSVKIMHDQFKELLSQYTIDSTHIKPLSIQLGYTWDNLTQTNTNEKKSLSMNLKEVEESFYSLRKRHALGQVSLAIYEEFSTEMLQRKESILKQLEKLNEKLSNPKELIKFTCDLSSNLTKIWELNDYYQKQILQNTLFPEGLVYDSENNHYRTPKINSVISYIAVLSMDLDNKKSRTFEDFSKKSGSVPKN